MNKKFTTTIVLETDKEHLDRNIQMIVRFVFEKVQSEEVFEYFNDNDMKKALREIYDEEIGIMIENDEVEQTLEDIKSESLEKISSLNEAKRYFMNKGIPSDDKSIKDIDLDIERLYKKISELHNPK